MDPAEVMQPVTITSRRHTRPAWAVSKKALVGHLLALDPRFAIAELYWLENKPTSAIARQLRMTKHAVEAVIKRLRRK